MARPSKHDGVVYKRSDSNIWWMRYRDKTGRRRQETTNTTDWDEAQRQMRERLAARDNNTLDSVRKGKQISFDEWTDFFLENYSKPPIRAEKTHEANQSALKNLRPVFGAVKLPEIDATQIEVHLRQRLRAKKRVHRKAGVVELGTIKACWQAPENVVFWTSAGQSLESGKINSMGPSASPAGRAAPTGYYGSYVLFRHVRGPSCVDRGKVGRG